MSEPGERNPVPNGRLAGPRDQGPTGQRRFPVLAIGVSLQEGAHLGGVDHSAVATLSYPEVTARTLAGLCPQLVLTPLFLHAHDVLDIGRRLITIGYRGTLRVVSDPIPDPTGVAREIQASLKPLNVSLVIRK